MPAEDRMTIGSLFERRIQGNFLLLREGGHLMGAALVIIKKTRSSPNQGKISTRGWVAQYRFPVGHCPGAATR